MKKHFITLLILILFSCEEDEGSSPSIKFMEGFYQVDTEEWYYLNAERMNGKERGNPIQVILDVSDDEGVTNISFFVNDELIFTKDFDDAPAEFRYHSEELIIPRSYEDNSVITYKAIATSKSGNQGETSDYITVDHSDATVFWNRIKSVNFEGSNYKIIWSKILKDKARYPNYEHFRKYNLYHSVGINGQKQFIQDFTGVYDTSYVVEGMDLTENNYFYISTVDFTDHEEISVGVPAPEYVSPPPPTVVITEEDDYYKANWTISSGQEFILSYKFLSSNFENMSNPTVLYESSSYDDSEYIIGNLPNNSTKYFAVELQTLTGDIVSSNIAWVSTYLTFYKTHTFDTNPRGYAATFTGDNEIIIAGEHNYDILLVKTDSNGELIWSQTHDYGTDAARSMILDEYNDIVLTGISGWGGGPPVLLAKFDQNDGGEIWETSFSYQRWNHGNDIIAGHNGGYVIASTHFGDEDGQSKIAIKTDQDGNLEWTASYTDDDGEPQGSKHIARTSDGGYITGGNQYLVKISSSGNVEWAEYQNEILFINVPESNSIDFIKSRSDGEEIIFLSYDNDMNYLNGNVLDLSQYNKVDHPNFGAVYRFTAVNDGFALLAKDIHNNCSLLKFDDLGNFEWARSYRIGMIDASIKGYSLAQHVDGGFYIIGETNNTDMIIIKTDPQGHNVLEVM